MDVLSSRELDTRGTVLPLYNDTITNRTFFSTGGFSRVICLRDNVTSCWHVSPGRLGVVVMTSRNRMVEREPWCRGRGRGRAQGQGQGRVLRERGENYGSLLSSRMSFQITNSVCSDHPSYISLYQLYLFSSLAVSQWPLMPSLPFSLIS